MSHQSVNMMEQLTREALNGIALAQHCQAGATIALSGALAVALGQATANGTLQEGAKGDAAVAARDVQQQMTAIRARLQVLADHDATTIGDFVRLRESGQELQGYELLCDGPQEMAELAVQAAGALQAFRRYVCERTHDDLEFAITLMAGVARSGMQLLDSNLRIWPLPELIAKYDHRVDELQRQIDALHPVQRIR